jgi:hypothetical protein
MLHRPQRIAQVDSHADEMAPRKPMEQTQMLYETEVSQPSYGKEKARPPMNRNGPDEGFGHHVLESKNAEETRMAVN